MFRGRRVGVRWRVFGCKLVGHQTAFKEEMVALFLAAYYAPEGTTIYLDRKGVITSVNKGGKRAIMGDMVAQIRVLMQEKSFKVLHVKKQVSIRGNEVANSCAQTCNSSII